MKQTTTHRCPTCGRPMPRVPGSPWAKAREASGLSVRQVAKQSGVSAATVSRLDNGEEVMMSSAVAVARVYGVTVEAMDEAMKAARLKGGASRD